MKPAQSSPTTAIPFLSYENGRSEVCASLRYELSRFARSLYDPRPKSRL